MPKVTVLMPVYNGAKYISEAINSVLAQTFQDFELLIVNDGSTDNTAEIVRSYKDPRIRLIENEKNIGLVATRNRGLKEASGEFIALLDSDDAAYPERTEKQLKFLETNSDFGMIGSWVKIIDENSNPTEVAWKDPIAPEKILPKLLFHNCFTQSSIMLRKNALPAEWYRQGFAPAEDYDLWVRISKKSKTWNLPEILVKYRIHGGNIVKRENDIQQKAVNEIILSQLGNLGIYPSAEELKVHRINYSYSEKDVKEFIQKREMWLKKLKMANHKKKYYSEPVFSEVISERWLATCDANAKLGSWMWKKFWQSELSKDLNKKENWKRILKFGIKCFAKKNALNLGSLFHKS